MKPEHSIRLSILIVTFNSAELIGPLLEHLKQELMEAFAFGTPQSRAEVIVLDNASNDQTFEIISTHYPWVNAIASSVNLGFAAGNNLAARQAQGHYLLLLNPDTRPQAGALAKALELLAQHPETGMAGGELMTPEGENQTSARMFPTLVDEFFRLSGLAYRFPHHPVISRLNRAGTDPLTACKVDWVTGAFVFIPRAVFRDLGGFDENFFMYFEEVDLCKRIRHAGLPVYYWPALKCVHIGGASAKTLGSEHYSASNAQIERWQMRSYFLYYRKYQGWAGAAGAFALEWVFCTLRRLLAVLKGRHNEAAHYTKQHVLLHQAWTDTAGGRVSPQRPW